MGRGGGGPQYPNGTPIFEEGGMGVCVLWGGGGAQTQGGVPKVGGVPTIPMGPQYFLWGGGSPKLLGVGGVQSPWGGPQILGGSRHL